MDRAWFARLVLDELRAAHPEATSTLDDDATEILVETEGGAVRTVVLENAWREHQAAAPSDRKALLERFVRSMNVVDSQETLDEVRVLLVPRIRPRRYFTHDIPAQTRAMAERAQSVVSPSGEQAHHTMLADHLGVAIAIDRPERVEYAMQPDSRFGAPASELHDIALTNLRRMTKAGLREVERGLLVGSWDDEYAVERMLLPELWDGLAIDGDPVAFLPRADTIFVAGSKDDVALAKALALSDELLTRPRPLVGHAFVRRHGEWSLYEDDTDVGAESASRLTLSLADAYALQREELEAAQHEDEDEDPPFVAGASGIAVHDGELAVVYTTWTDGVTTWLPRAHYVALGRLTEARPEPLMVPWRALFEHAAAHLEVVPDVYPPRWQTTADLPTGDVWHALERQAVPVSDLVGHRSAKTQTKEAAREASGATMRRSLAARTRPPLPREPEERVQKWFLFCIALGVVLAIWVLARQ
jgi:hypothetical protein